MKMFSVTPLRVSRTASASVRRIVSASGGHAKYACSPSRCAVGSPSVTMITCRIARGCWASSRPASRNACCMFVPYVRSKPGAARSSGFRRRA